MGQGIIFFMDSSSDSDEMFMDAASSDPQSQPPSQTSWTASTQNFFASRMPSLRNAMPGRNYSKNHEKISGDKKAEPQVGLNVQTVQQYRHEGNIPESGTVTRLNQQVVDLQDEVRRLHDKVQSLEQGQDFRSHYKVPGTPHDKMQQQLNTIRVGIQGWIRMALKGWMSRFDGFLASDYPETRFPEFGAALLRICHDDVTADVLQGITVSDVLAAIASHMIVEQAVMNPLGPCTRKFREGVDSDVYKIMAKVGLSQGERFKPFRCLSSILVLLSSGSADTPQQ